MAARLSENMVVVFFLDSEISAQDLSRVEEKIKASPAVVEVKFISRDRALDRFKANFPELDEIIKDLKANPFPASFEAVLKRNVFMSDEILGFIDSIKGLPGVADVQFNRDWVKKMQSLSRLARAIGFLFGGILIFASFFIISNVIRLNVFSRKNEIEILRLVGATNAFIRLPFLLEGTTLGFLGSLISLGLLYVLIKLFPLYLGHTLGALQEFISFRYLSLSQSLSLILGAALMGFLGSLSSLSRFLKI